MIGISNSLAIFIYMTVWLLLVVLLWCRLLLRRKRTQWGLTNSHLFNCDSCHFAFLTKEEVNLTRCPRCNAICIRRRKRKNITGR
jgi:hypothetical protein